MSGGLRDISASKFKTNRLRLGRAILHARFNGVSVTFFMIWLFSHIYGNIESGSSAQATGVKVKIFMNKKIKYSNEPLNELKLASDFLPSPQELSLRNRNTKITISLSTESINFFKDQANQHGMQYQKMIRQLLDDYVTQQKALTSSNSQRR